MSHEDEPVFSHFGNGAISSSTAGLVSACARLGPYMCMYSYSTSKVLGLGLVYMYS